MRRLRLGRVARGGERGAVVRTIGRAVTVLALAGCGRAPAVPPVDVHAFYEALGRAVAASPGSVRRLEWDDVALPGRTGRDTFGPGVGSNVTSGDGFRDVFAIQTDIAWFRWEEAVAAAPNGAPEVAIAHAEAQAKVLAASGFVAIDAGTSVVNAGSYGAPQAKWSLQQAGGHGGSGHAVETRPARLVHRRAYWAPGTPAFILARTEYESATGVARVEMTLVAASPGTNTAAPDLRIPMTETISAAR